MFDLNRILTFIKFKDKDGKFKLELEIIQQTQYEFKSPIEPWSGRCTTYSNRYVRLAHNFDSWWLSTQAATLIHEATHEKQYDRVGRFTFYVNYLLQAFRGYYNNSYEQEALLREQEFLRLL